MELLAFNDEGISDLATDNHDDDFGALLVHFVEDSSGITPRRYLSLRTEDRSAHRHPHPAGVRGMGNDRSNRGRSRSEEETTRVLWHLGESRLATRSPGIRVAFIVEHRDDDNPIAPDPVKDRVRELSDHRLAGVSIDLGMDLGS
jgi:hypothetical protein